VTNEIQTSSNPPRPLERPHDWRSQIGGTVGDIESLPFLEAARQMSLRSVPARPVYVHLTLVPVHSGGRRAEDQADPHSVQSCARSVSRPTCCCAGRPADSREEPRQDFAVSNVALDAVISVWDVDSIYKISDDAAPAGTGRDRVLPPGYRRQAADLSAWDAWSRAEHPLHEVRVGMVGKYVELSDSYKSLTEALIHAGIHTRKRREDRVRRYRADRERPGLPDLRILDAILVREGSAVAALRKDRSDPPRARAGRAVPWNLLRDAIGDHRVRAPRGAAEGGQQHEFERDTRHPVGRADHEWTTAAAASSAAPSSDLGGTMRLARRSARSSRLDGVPDLRRRRSTSGIGIGTR